MPCCLTPAASQVLPLHPALRALPFTSAPLLPPSTQAHSPSCTIPCTLSSVDQGLEPPAKRCANVAPMSACCHCATAPLEAQGGRAGCRLRCIARRPRGGGKCLQRRLGAAHLQVPVWVQHAARLLRKAIHRAHQLSARRRSRLPLPPASGTPPALPPEPADRSSFAAVPRAALAGPASSSHGPAGEGPPPRVCHLLPG